MKKVFIFFLALAAAGSMMFTGCKKEYQTVSLGLELESAPAGSKVEIDADYNPVLRDGDYVNVNGTSYPVSVDDTGKYVVEVQSCTTGYFAAYPASLATSETGFSGTTNQAVHMPRWQAYKYEVRNGVRVQDVQLPSGAYIAANDNGKKLKFYNFCSLLEVEWKNTSESDAYDIIGIEVTVPGAALYGDGTVTLNGTSSSMTLSDVHKNRVNLDITASQRETVAAGGTSSKYYVVLPTFTGQVTVRIQTMKHSQTTLDDQKLKTVTVQTSGSVTMPRNTIVPIHVESTPKEDNSLTGYFSVRGDGHGNDTYKVVFSRGNLQRIGSSEPIWKFADRQYDFFGTRNLDGYGTEITDNEDLFAWSDESGRSNYGRYTYDDWTDAGGWLPTDASGDYFRDWGELSISGDPANTWFTMTSDEWSYLFHHRVNQQGASLRGKAKITGVNGHPAGGTGDIYGFVLLPDDWTSEDLPTGLNFTSAADNAGSSAFENVYSVSEWARLEAAGAMFLPAAGYGAPYDAEDGDDGDEILDTYLAGQYWTSDRKSGGNYAESYYLAFQYNDYQWHLMVSGGSSVGSSHYNANYDMSWYYLRSVRLVKHAPGYTAADRVWPNANNSK